MVMNSGVFLLIYRNCHYQMGFADKFKHLLSNSLHATNVGNAIYEAIHNPIDSFNWEKAF